MLCAAENGVHSSMVCSVVNKVFQELLAVMKGAEYD